MAHVLRMPGAISFARTTDEAVAEAPKAIRNYLRYLKRHGEKVDPKAEIRTRVAEHVTEGGFISTMFFSPDLEPVTPAEVAPSVDEWLEWSRADLLKLVDGLTPTPLRRLPPPVSPLTLLNYTLLTHKPLHQKPPSTKKNSARRSGLRLHAFP